MNPSSIIPSGIKLIPPPTFLPLPIEKETTLFSIHFFPSSKEYLILWTLKNKHLEKIKMFIRDKNLTK